MAAIGIDLGTTNTVVAAVRDGRALTLEDEKGNRLIPSVVAFAPQGDVLVGQAAKERRYNDPANTIYSVKRLIGRPWKSPEVQQSLTRFPFELREGPKDTTMVVARGRQYALPEVSAFVLRRAKAIAEHRLGTKVDKAVITVPANFNDLQRAATKVAGKLAGLEVLRILNEPTAAALAYGQSIAQSERIAVFDLGGGTFDITLLDLSGQVFEVLATAGDTSLGGDDVDVLIADRMAAQLREIHRFDAMSHPEAFGKLRLLAEKLKIQLSLEQEVTLAVNDVAHGEGGAPLNTRFRMNRKELEHLVKPLIDRTLKVSGFAIETIASKRDAFDRVILVGGSTRMPMVARRVEEFFGKPPFLRVNPDEVVALGAAIQAFALDKATRKKASSSPPPSIGRAEQTISQITPAPQSTATQTLQATRTLEAPNVPRSAITQPDSAPLPPMRPRLNSFDALDAMPRGPAPPPSAPKAAPSSPKATLVGPNAMAGGPNALAGGPKAIGGDPKAIGGDPKAIAGGPKTLADRPKATLIGPQAVAEGLNAIPDGPKVPMRRPMATLLGTGAFPDAPKAAPSAPKPFASPAENEPPSLSFQIEDPAFDEPSGVTHDVTQSDPPKAQPASRGEDPSLSFNVAEPPDLRLEDRSISIGGGTVPMAAAPPVPPNARAHPPRVPPARQEIPSMVDLPRNEKSISFTLPLVGAPARPPELELPAGPPNTAIVAENPAPWAPPSIPAQPAPAAESAARELDRGIPTRAAAPLLIDVTPLSLSVETVGGWCDVLIPANTPVPCDRSRVFLTASDGQTVVWVNVAQGESRRFGENTFLGQLELRGLDPKPRGEVRIEVTFEIDADGILNVRARDVAQGREVHARMRLLGGSTAQDVEAMLARQAQHEVH